jgi:hypothetical protein
VGLKRLLTLVEKQIFRAEVPKLWGALPPREVAIGLLGGSCFMRDIFILKEIWAQGKIFLFWYALYLVEIFYLSSNTGTGSEL